jgi:hypothetical protein
MIKTEILESLPRLGGGTRQNLAARGNSEDRNDKKVE